MHCCQELDEKEGIQPVNSIHSVTLDRIKEKLRSKSLQDALRIVMISIVNHFPSFEALTLIKIERILEDISQNLQLVQCLHTRFLLLPNLHDVTKTASILLFQNGQAMECTEASVSSTNQRVIS